MAAGVEEADTSSLCVTVTLTEDDIPGAALTEPFENHTVSQLRWWLLCRGIVVPTSWKKPQIIQRFVLTVSSQILFTLSPLLTICYV